MPLDPDRYFDANPVARSVARSLYQKVAALPLVCPHGHVDPRILAENTPFPDPASLIVIPDHYIFRMLYSQGIPLESLGIPLPGEPVGGLSLRRLDGGWTVFTTANGLADNFVRAIASDAAGNLWVASYDKGLSRRDGSGAWTVFDMAAGALASNTVQALAVAPDGTVYAGTAAGLAIRSVAGLWRNLDQTDGLPAAAISSLHREADGRLWIGTAEGVAVLAPDGRLTTYLPQDGALLPGTIGAMAVDPSGAPWLASHGAGIAVLDAAWRTDR